MSLVLVHGANFSSAYWKYCVPYLRREVLKIDWPGPYTDDFAGDLSFGLIAEAALRDMDAAGVGSATLVGHSIGAHIIRVMADRVPERIKRLVFLAGPILSEGERWLGSVVPDGQVLLRQWQAEGRYSYNLPPDFVPAFCNDMDEREKNLTVENMRPGPVQLFFEPINRLAGTDAIPCTYIKLLRDQMLPPELQDIYIARLSQCKIITIDSGHIAMISRPEELAEILNDVD